MKGVHATHRSVEAARGGCIYTQQIGRAHLAHPDIHPLLYRVTALECPSYSSIRLSIAGRGGGVQVGIRLD